MTLVQQQTPKHTPTSPAPRLRSRIPKPHPMAMFTPAKLSEIFDGLQPAAREHPYIKEKRGISDGLQVVPDDSALVVHGKRVGGWLAFPIRSLDGQLRSIHFLSGDGDEINPLGASFGDDGMFVVGTIDENQPIYVCERIEHAWSCSRAEHTAAVVAFNAGQMLPVAKTLRSRYKTAKIVLVAARGREVEIELVSRQTACSFVVMPADKSPDYSASDFERENGSAALAERLRASLTPSNRFCLQTADELLASPPFAWLVKGVLPASGFAAVFGPSGSGKSFLVLDLCAAIATGESWFGRRVTSAPVTYLVLEGAAGFGKRAKAWTLRRNQKLPDNLRFIGHSLDLRNRGELAELAAAVVANGAGGGLLVIDTLNRAAPGADENSSTDMGQLIAGCNALQKAVGGVVLVVHHTGKDGAKGLRGHSSLLAALDAAIEVHQSNSRREWSVAKSKDDAAGERFGFVLDVVAVGTDGAGETISSCAVGGTVTSPQQMDAAKEPIGKTQKVVFAEIKKRLCESPAGTHCGAPVDKECISFAAAIAFAAERLAEGCKPGRQRYLAQRAIGSLQKNGYLEMKNGYIWQK